MARGRMEGPGRTTIQEGIVNFILHKEKQPWWFSAVKITGILLIALVIFYYFNSGKEFAIYENEAISESHKVQSEIDTVKSELNQLMAALTGSGDTNQDGTPPISRDGLIRLRVVFDYLNDLEAKRSAVVLRYFVLKFIAIISIFFVLAIAYGILETIWSMLIGLVRIFMFKNGEESSEKDAGAVGPIIYAVPAIYITAGIARTCITLFLVFFLVIPYIFEVMTVAGTTEVFDRFISETMVLNVNDIITMIERMWADISGLFSILK